MPSKTLTDLAPELIIQILKSSDNLADLTSLGSTSRKLFIIWKTNDSAICEAVLTRSVPCYEQILEQLQELSSAQAAVWGVESDEYSVFGFQSASDRAKRILKEADTAAKALVYLENDICKLWVSNELPDERLTLAERTDFVRAYHRAVTLVTIRENALPCSLFTAWNFLDLMQVVGVMEWLEFFCPRDQLQNLVVWLDYKYSDHNIAGIIDSGDWNSFCRCVLNLGLVLARTSEQDQNTVSLAPYFPFIFRNHYQDQYRSNRGACLADLTALARRKGDYYDITIELSQLSIREAVERRRQDGEQRSPGWT